MEFLTMRLNVEPERGDLLVKLSRVGNARARFEYIASLTRHERDRVILLERASGCS